MLPPIYRQRQYLAVGAFVVLVGISVPNLVESGLNRNLVNLWLVYSLVTLGFYFVFGIAGQFAFSQAFMMALGAYTSAYVARTEPFWVSFAAALLVVGIVAALFALLMRHATHFYFAIASLGFSEIGLLVFRKIEGLTGPGGQVLNIPRASLLGYEFAGHERFFWLALGALAVGLLLAVFTERSPIKREAIAIRDREHVAQTFGLPILKYRVLMFVLGSCFAAAGGSLYAHWNGFLSTDAFGVDLGIGIFLMLILGGMHSMWGPIAGAAFFVFVPEQLHSIAQYRTIFYGTLLVVVMIAFPDGLLGALRDARARVNATRGGRLLLGGRWFARAGTDA